MGRAVHRLGPAFLGPALCIFVSCGQGAPPSPISLAPEQSQPVAQADLQENRCKPVLPEKPTFCLYQRLTKNNYWDSGKAISVEMGEALLDLLSGSQRWSPEDHPQYVSAWGTHPYTPGYGAILEVSSGGRATRYRFCSGCDLFDAGSSLWVVNRESKERLVALLRSLGDRNRVKFWR
jgi:hypothetical protein